MSESGYNYSRFPAPEGACPVCWHRFSRVVSVAACAEHTPDEREFFRGKECSGNGSGCDS